MHHLFIFVTHGGQSNIAMFRNILLSLHNPKVLGIALRYDESGSAVKLEGTKQVSEWVQAQPDSPDYEVLFWELLAFLVNKYDVKREQTILYCEANLLVMGGGTLTLKALHYINSIIPHLLVLFSGTANCRKNTLNWIQQLNYSLYEPLFIPDYIDTEDTDVSLCQIVDISDEQGTLLSLTIPSPKIVVLNKHKVVPSMNYFIELLALRNQLPVTADDGYHEVKKKSTLLDSNGNSLSLSAGAQSLLSKAIVKTSPVKDIVAIVEATDNDNRTQGNGDKEPRLVFHPPRSKPQKKCFSWSCFFCSGNAGDVVPTGAISETFSSSATV